MQDKWDAWRHLSMLGNVKTQGRNFFGTAAFMPYRAAKQAIGSIIEKAIPKVKPDTNAAEILSYLTGV